MYPQPVLQVASVAIKGFTVDANTDEFQDKTVSVLLDLVRVSLLVN